MWHILSTILIYTIGCVLLPFLVIGSLLLLPQDDLGRWRPQPPLR